MDKVKTFQTVGRVEYWERVPRLQAYGVFALPFPMASTVDWSRWFNGPHPRGFLVSVNNNGEVEPTDLSSAQSKSRVVGMVLDGHDYTKDRNVLVTLRGAVPVSYIQQDPNAPALQPHAPLMAAAESMGIKVLKGHYFFDFTLVR